MEEFRSKSYGDGRSEMESYCEGRSKNGWGKSKPTSSNGNARHGFDDLRCYSASYTTSVAATSEQQPPTFEIPRDLRRGKSANGSMSSRAGWCFSDPELQRKKRVASYKTYSVEGKIKRSFSKSFRWLKDRYSNMVHDW